jgi:hypothetical protein
MKSCVRKRSSQFQRGFLMLELGLVLLITALAGVATWQATQRASDADLAKLQGDAIAALRSAAHKLVMTNYSAYQAGQAISRNSVTLADGDTAGQSRNPTVANLRSMDLAVDSAQSTGFYKSLNNANYAITIERSATCATNAASANCQVTGLVCLDQPVRPFNSATGEVDTFGLGVMLARLGGVGGASLVGSANTILSVDGTWSKTNTYATAGIVCARFGWGSEGDDYLRVSDTRDPSFQGGASITGTVPNSTFALVVNGNASITGQLSLSGSGTLGSGCTPEGSAVWGTVGSVSTLLKCVGGVWKSTGFDESTAGASCSPDGKPALTSTGAQLTCRDGTYRDVKDLLGRQGVYQISSYSHGATVTSPVCGSATSGRLIPLGVTSACTLGAGSGTCSNDTGSFVGSISTSRVVSIVGSDGSTVAGSGAQLVVASVCSTY